LGSQLEELQRPPLDILLLLLRLSQGRDEDLRVSKLDPATPHLVMAVTLLTLPTIDHVIMKHVEVAAALPDLRVHDDRGVEPDHFVRGRGPHRNAELIVAANHVQPPSLLQIPLQLDAQGAVIPEPLQTSVD